MYGDTDRGGASTAQSYVTCDLSSLTDCVCTNTTVSEDIGSSSKRKYRSKPSPLIDPDSLTPLTAKRLILERPSLIDQLIFKSKSAISEMEGKKRGPRQTTSPGKGKKVEKELSKRKRTESINGIQPAVKRLRSAKGASDSESSDSRNTSIERKDRRKADKSAINRGKSPKKRGRKPKSRFSKRIVFTTSALRSGKKRIEFMKSKRRYKHHMREAKDKKNNDKTDSNSNVCTDSNEDVVDDSTDSEMCRETFEGPGVGVDKEDSQQVNETVKRRRKKRKRDSMWVKKIKRVIKAKTENAEFLSPSNLEYNVSDDKDKYDDEYVDALEECDIPVLNKESDDSLNVNNTNEILAPDSDVPDDDMPKLEKQVEIDLPIVNKECSSQVIENNNIKENGSILNRSDDESNEVKNQEMNHPKYDNETADLENSHSSLISSEHNDEILDDGSHTSADTDTLLEKITELVGDTTPSYALSNMESGHESTSELQFQVKEDATNSLENICNNSQDILKHSDITKQQLEPETQSSAASDNYDVALSFPPSIPHSDKIATILPCSAQPDDRVGQAPPKDQADPNILAPRGLNDKLTAALPPSASLSVQVVSTITCSSVPPNDKESQNLLTSVPLEEETTPESSLSYSFSTDPGLSNNVSDLTKIIETISESTENISKDSVCSSESKYSPIPPVCKSEIDNFVGCNNTSEQFNKNTDTDINSRTNHLLIQETRGSFHIEKENDNDHCCIRIKQEIIEDESTNFEHTSEFDDSRHSEGAPAFNADLACSAYDQSDLAMESRISVKDRSLSDPDSTTDVKQSLDDSFTLSLPDDMRLESSPSESEDRSDESESTIPDSTENVEPNHVNNSPLINNVNHKIITHPSDDVSCGMNKNEIGGWSSDIKKDQSAPVTTDITTDNHSAVAYSNISDDPHVRTGNKMKETDVDFCDLNKGDSSYSISSSLNNFKSIPCVPTNDDHSIGLVSNEFVSNPPIVFHVKQEPKVPESADFSSSNSLSLNQDVSATVPSSVQSTEVEKVPEVLDEELDEEQRQIKESVLQALGLKSRSNQQPIEKPRKDGYTGTLKAVIKRSGDKKRMVYQRTEDSLGELEYKICSEIPSTDGVPITHLNDISGVRKNMTKLHHDSDHSHASTSSNGHPEEHAIHDDSKGSSGGKESSLIIPEKSSSFSIHPGRLCSDVCSYCFGKFGSLDTPCHIAQLKAERQKKILENEPHLTLESCLCDACFRYVDRKANCPKANAGNKTRVKPPASSQCCVNHCSDEPTHTIKKKWLIKLKKSITNKLDIDLDKHGGMYVPLCKQHHYWVDYFMVCGICRKRLNRNHLYPLDTETDQLNLILAEDGIPARLNDKLFLCKMCRYYSNLRLKYSDPRSIPPGSQIFYRDHRKKILNSLDVPVSDSEDEHTIKEDKKKPPGKKGMNDNIVNSNCAAQATKSDESVMSLNNLASLLGEQPEQQARIQVKFGNVNIGRLSNLNIGQSGRDRDERMPYSDVSLQANLEFQGPTVPDGSWESCTSNIQFDKRTKKLWHDLQKPYGNQSSFLRHLVMLEKYWRAGYLILAQGSDERAAKYLNGVKNRIKAFEGNSGNPVTGQECPSISVPDKFPLITNTGEIEVTAIRSTPKTPVVPIAPEKKQITPLDRAKSLVRMVVPTVPPPQRSIMSMQRLPVPMYAPNYGYSTIQPVQQCPPPLLKIRNKTVPPNRQFYHHVMAQPVPSSQNLRPILPKLPKALSVTSVPQGSTAITLNRSGITIEKQSGSSALPSRPIEKPSVSVFREPAPGPS